MSLLKVEQESSETNHHFDFKVEIISSIRENYPELNPNAVETLSNSIFNHLITGQIYGSELQTVIDFVYKDVLSKITKVETIERNDTFVDFVPTKITSTTKKLTKSEMRKETNKTKEVLSKKTISPMPIPDIPQLIDSIDLGELVELIKLEKPNLNRNEKDYKIVFELKDDRQSNFTRAIQEMEILKTRLKVKDKYGKLQSLPSFWDVWYEPGSKLPEEILSSSDPHEEKWNLTKKYGYKLASTFMPGYAKAIYDYFKADYVLDPCAGWGDRMTGAMLSKYVKNYIGFDPNANLRPGYIKIMEALGESVSEETKEHIEFSNGFEIHTKPYEKGIITFGDDSFDFAFTSPPFFDYEDYSPDNPKYRDWIKEFYEPLFIETARVLKNGSFFAVYLEDTSAGKIEDFMMNTVPKISTLDYAYLIGIKGIYSDRIRNVYVFENNKEE